MFNKDIHVVRKGDVQTEGDYYVSSDYGIQNATVFLLWQKEVCSKRWICLNEYYYSGRDNHYQKTVSEHVKGLIQMLNGIEPRAIIVDPSASALITEIRRKGYHVRRADNDVKEGIDDVSTMLANQLLAFCDCCVNTIGEFGIYSWDEKASERGEDAPLKENDHAMDATRYFVRTKYLVRRTNKGE